MNLEQHVQRWFNEDQDVLNDRWPLYRELREQGGIYRASGSVLVSRHSDVGEVLSDARRFQNGPFAGGASGLHDVPNDLDPEQLARVEDIINLQAHWMTSTNGEKHEQLRRMGARIFTPRAVADLTSSIEAVTQRLLDTVDPGTEVEFVRAIAFRLPLMVVADILDIDDERRDRLHQLRLGMLKMLSGVAWRRALPRDLDESHAAYMQMSAVLYEFIEEKRWGTSSLLLRRMFEAQDADAAVSDEDLVGILSQLFAAGHQTTQDLLSSALFQCLSMPDAWAELRCTPDSIPDVVEEVLRYRSPAQTMERTAVVDTEVAGQEIHAGERMVCLIGSANRDEARFESPAEFKPTRSDVGYHLAFSQGPHFCLGAALSRLEATAALRAIAERFPNTKIRSREVDWVGGISLLGPAALTLEFG